jgi:hypothetical protein
MGCDIHLYSETKRNGRWMADKAATFFQGKEDPEDTYETTTLEDSYEGGRNYRLFGLLAGVRCSWPFSFEERGLPDDMSDQVKKLSDSWEGDAHSHSWLTRQELQHKATELMISPEEGAHMCAGYLQSLLADLPVTDNPDPSEQRIVFWFDN